MKRTTPVIFIACLLLLTGCGQSYEESKRQTKQQQKEKAKLDSAALKIAVMPTLDCLPLFVAQHLQLLDTLHGGVRLKFFAAQMDCDTALERNRVQGAATDLVRAKAMEKRGKQLRYVAATNAHWQLIANHNARIRQLKQLDDKMVAMTRFSATDMLTDRVTDSVKLDKDRVFKVQINDVAVRLLMLQNNEMDALWMPEPQATAARIMNHNIVYDTRKEDIRLGVLAFDEKEMQHPERSKQLELLTKAYNQACDSINKYGVKKYSALIVKHCKVKAAVANKLPENIKFEHAQGPREKDIALAERYMGNSKPKTQNSKNSKNK